MKNRINLDLGQYEKTAAVCKALSSPERLKMLQVLVEASSGMNISELADRVALPLSTTAFHVKALEETGMIFTEEKPGLRGAQKICAILAEDVYINLYGREKHNKPAKELGGYSMPIGNYFDCLVSKPCGMASKKNFIGIEDSEYAFYGRNRFQAQIIWFTAGFVEYRFSNYFLRNEKVLEASFSFEACSEAPGYNNDWPSDISVWINNEEVFGFRCAGDYGGKRGIYTPSWWPESSTQYGELHRLVIQREGCYGDGRKTSDHNLETLGICRGDYVSLKIGIREDAECVGGINLFGESFGNYKQNIEMNAKLER